TDSLASNSSLNILAEIIVLQQAFEIGLHDLIKWGTQNGAEFLGIADKFGTLKPGKCPGINLIQVDTELRITSNKVQRLI
ncbi:MAG: amidohydrolase, partial [Chitinophagaceae bacterium]